jgi:hypothetical protein
MRRRDFIVVIDGFIVVIDGAAAWPLSVRAGSPNGEQLTR